VEQQTYTVVKGITPPLPSRPLKRTSLDGLLEVAQRMEVGDAVVMRSAEAQVFRYLLFALGYHCITDGYRCTVRGCTLAFKLPGLNTPPPINWDI
jgi:hypothetical protein